MSRLSVIALTFLLFTSANAKVQPSSAAQSQMNGATVSQVSATNDAEVQRHHHRRHRHHRRR